MEGKEEIPGKKYDIICGKNEYVLEEGLFPNKFKHLSKHSCTLCDIYKLGNLRVLRRFTQNTREVWVHPDIEALPHLSADNKAMSEIVNVKKSTY